MFGELSACDTSALYLMSRYRFLFVGKAALDTLTAYGNKKRAKPFDKGPLETLFPRLAVVFFRISDLERREADPNKPVQYKFSRMPYPQTTNITQIAADIYRPIKPFRLMSACVIGSHLRETCVADTVICEAANFDENDSCELPDWTPPKRPRKVKVIDNLYKVSFKPNGKFLPQAEGDAFDFPGRIGDHPEIEVDSKALDNDTADGSRSRDIAKGIFALLPPRTMKLGQFDKLPQIRVVQGHGVTYMPLLSEVCYIFYVTRSAILNELLLACTAFPPQGLHKHIRLETALAIPNRQRLQMGCCAIASKVCRSQNPSPTERRQEHLGNQCLWCQRLPRPLCLVRLFNRP